MIRTRIFLAGWIALTLMRPQAAFTLPAQPTTATNTVDRRVAEIVRDWDSLPGVFDDIEIYSGQVRELVQIGQPAVPALTAALDQTDRGTTLCLLGFTLRAIGDPRAVPALVRAIPKTLRPPESDCGMSVADPDLQSFMAKHDLSGGKERGFGIGRPVREICGALRKITGTNQNDGEIYLTFLDGGDRQRAVERRAYETVADRWVSWWHDHWARYVQDPALANIRLPASLHMADPGVFLTGPDIKMTYGDGNTVCPIENGGEECLVALNLANTFSLPRALSSSNTAAGSLETDTAWAAQAGADLIGTQWKDPVSGKMFYCLRGIGLQAWEIANERWETMADEIARGAPLPTGDPAGDLLMHYDAAHNRYDPARKATFLFVTREGTQGILRIVAQVNRPPHKQAHVGFPESVEDTGVNQTEESGDAKGVRIDYKLFYQETGEMKAEAKSSLDADNALVAARRHKLAMAHTNEPHFSGKVFLPGGAPASNAAVVLLNKGESVLFSDCSFPSESLITIDFTRADGSFALPMDTNAAIIDAAHDEGFAVLDLSTAKPPLEIHLAPWGRIEGTMLLEGKPAAHEKLDLSYGMNNPGHLALGTMTAISDDRGRFVFTNIPPMEIVLERPMNGSSYGQQYFAVTSGQTTKIEYGYHGRLLKGHFAMSDSSNNDSWNGGWGFRLLSKQPPLPAHPEGSKAMSWWFEFQNSPEGMARQRASRSFGIRVEPNGDFKIEDVPAGTYEFDVALRETPSSTAREIGRFTNEITVPSFLPAEESQPLDLGELTLEKTQLPPEIQELKLGDVAPDFKVKTVNGGNVHLADFRGKYVLLDFWATWCVPCRRQIPNLKSVYDTYGSDQRFALIGLSLDKATDAPRDYARTNNMPWTQGFLGDWSKANLPDKYGVDGIPSIYLIDPAGKIAATDLSGEDIAAAVGRALGAK